MKFLGKYLKDYKKESIFAPLFKMLEATFDLFVPLVMADIVNVGIAAHDFHYILVRCGLLLLLAFIGLTCSLTAQYFSAKAAVGYSTALRHALFAHIQSLSFSEMDTLGTSTLITRMTSDINQVQSGLNLFLRLFLRSPFIVVGALVMALTIDAKISLIFLLVIVLLSVIVAVIMKCTVPMYKNVQNTLDSVTLMTRENLTGARVIRAFTEEDDEYNKFKEKNNLLAHFQRSVGRISALMNPITYIIINLGIVLLIYSGALKVESGTLNQGQVVALYNYMSQILVELVKFASLIVTITKGFASGGRIASILNVDNTLEHSDDTNCYNNHAVCFDNVSLTYKGAGEESLTDISFFADKGQTIGIIGSTGSGKSSLVSLIPHYYDATKGRVTVNGRDVKSFDKEELRSNIGFVMQKAVLFAGTVRDNIKWGKKDATDEEINEALRIAQVYDNVYEKDGLDTVIEQNGANLSGGQKQRLSIARAIVSKPEIIVLDDSASALDFATEKALREAILSLDYKPTLFIVSERTSSILSADKIIVLEDGQIDDVGTNEQLLKSCEVYREIYFSQFSEEEVAVGD